MLERLTVRRATALLFTTSALRDEVAGHYGAAVAAKCHVVRNGCDPEELVNAKPLPRPDRFTLAHVGTLYGGRDPLPLLRALAAAIDAGAIDPHCFRLRLIGAVALTGRSLDVSCRELGLSGVVECVPRVRRRESLAAMQEADALLVLQPDHPLSVPGKLYEYFAAGKPILALTDEGETAELVRQSGSGLVVGSTDEGAIRDALVALANGAVVAAPSPRAVFDGRLRAVEMANVLGSMVSERGRRRRHAHA
jgi:glycosyltransferase involved in cell wall biosynthesis